jgi:hypothetical protein
MIGYWFGSEMCKGLPESHETGFQFLSAKEIEHGGRMKREA